MNSIHRKEKRGKKCICVVVRKKKLLRIANKVKELTLSKDEDEGEKEEEKTF